MSGRESRRKLLSRLRRPGGLVAASAVLYLLVSFLFWSAATSRARQRIDSMLSAGVAGFTAVIDGEIEAALRNAGGAIINLFKGRYEPLPLAEMQRLATTFNLDEINVIDRSGKVIGSNIPSVIGFDFNDDARTREFMALTNSTVTQVTQAFRKGVANPDMVCKYYGLSFPGHRQLLQLGISPVRLRQNMYSYTEEESRIILQNWHFCEKGWYARCPDDSDFAEGKTFLRRAPDGEMLIGRYFSYFDFKYVVLLPEDFCYTQRNALLLIALLVLAVLFVLFDCIVLWMWRASDKIESMHRARAARTAADLALARTIQMSVLPSENTLLDRLEYSFVAQTLPAREVGGDFYDFYRLPGGKVAFIVADVSGKGIPGAMFMMEAKNILKNCLVEKSDVADAVAAANAGLCAHNLAELFVTAWVGVLDPQTGMFEYVNAGHNRPFVRRVDGTVEKVMGKGGRFLGMFADATYRSQLLKLAPGDFLYLYTDGVTEAMNAKGEQFGEERLVRCLRDQTRFIDSALAEFVGEAERSDDVTGLLLRWNGEPRRLARDFPCRAESLAEAVGFIRQSLAGIERMLVAKVLNAADEVTSNIVNYSGAETYRIEVEQIPDRLRLRFIDSGRAYNPLRHADPDTHAAIEDRPVGGLGLVMVKRLVDHVSYAYENSRNVLSLILRINYDTEEQWINANKRL